MKRTEGAKELEADDEEQQRVHSDHLDLLSVISNEVISMNSNDFMKQFEQYFQQLHFLNGRTHLHHPTLP